MGKGWDKLDWQSGGSFSKPGIGERQTSWPSFSAASPFGSANPTCSTCGGRLRGEKKCSCAEPDWKVRGLPIARDAQRRSAWAQQAWHHRWLVEAFRVLEPGGVIKAFGGTRVFHRLGMAMEDTGFVDVGLEAFSYGSGFPKSHSVGKNIDRLKGVTRKVVGYKRGVGGENMNDIVRGVTVRDTTEAGAKGVGAYGTGAKQVAVDVPITVPGSPEAMLWEGWGTALKPAWEPVLVGHKPR